MLSKQLLLFDAASSSQMLVTTGW